MRLRHAHISGRFSRPSGPVEKELNHYLRTNDLVTMTEVANTDHRVALKAALAEHPSFHIYHPRGSANIGETAILWKDPIKRVAKGHVLTTTKTYYAKGGGKRQPVEATWVVLENNGVKGLVTVAHMPVHADGPTGFTGPIRRVIAYHAVARGWKRKIKAVRRKYGVATRNVMFVADWNLDHKKSWVRAYLRSVWPSLPTTWRKQRVKKGVGTIGFKWIDATLTKATVLQAPKVEPMTSGSDHRPYTEVLRFFSKKL